MVQRVIPVILIFFCFWNVRCAAQPRDENSSLKLVATIPLLNVSGRIDHLAFDSERQLIFVAALGNNTVEVIDLRSKKVIHTLKNLDEPQGIFFISESKHLIVANGGNGECDIFDTETYQKINVVKLPGDADNVRYDSVTKKIYVGYGNGGLAIIDATNYKLIADIKLSGHPESFQLDRSAKRIYINVPDGKQIEVVDLEKNRVIDRWKMTEASSNFPMSLDDANHHLFIGCRHPAKLVVIDTQTGKMITSVAIDSDVDDVFYNKTNGQIYLSCGGGSIDIFKQTDVNIFTANGKIPTYFGARTSLLIPEQNHFVVASPLGLKNNAALLIYNVK